MTPGTCKTFIIRFLGCSILLSIIISGPGETHAGRNSRDFVPSRYGFALILGNTYNPENDIRFSLISGFALYDYDRIWHHPAPAPLRFKVEGSLGATTSPRTRAVASCGIMALYYLDKFATQRLRPYGEAGIGIIYTDFRVKGQGLRINFNPQAGFGTEFLTGSGSPFFTTLRLHHISNGDLYKDNRGVNAVVLVLGYFFH
ncbi:MAG: acyloxyacyl hydrolase [bacterium]